MFRVYSNKSLDFGLRGESLVGVHKEVFDGLVVKGSVELALKLFERMLDASLLLMREIEKLTGVGHGLPSFYELDERRSSMRLRTRRSISSRIDRTSSIGIPAGSGSSQSRYRLAGYTGQASPQPIVTMTSALRPTSSLNLCGDSCAMSMPFSNIALTTAGLRRSPGSEPAECTTTPSPPISRANAAAI